MKKPLRCYLGWHCWVMREGHTVDSHNVHIWRQYKFIVCCPLCRKINPEATQFLAYDENGRTISEVNFEACGVTVPETLEEWFSGTSRIGR